MADQPFGVGDFGSTDSRFIESIIIILLLNTECCAAFNYIAM